MSHTEHAAADQAPVKVAAVRTSDKRSSSCVRYVPPNDDTDMVVQHPAPDASPSLGAGGSRTFTISC